MSKLSSRELLWHKIDRAAIENDCLFSIIYIQRCGIGGMGREIIPHGIEKRNILGE